MRGGRVSGQGWLVGPYFVAKHSDHPVFTDSFDTQRMLAQLKVSGALNFGATTLRPSLQMSYAADEQKAYTDSLGNLIPVQKVALFQAGLGMDVSHYVPLEKDTAPLELTGGVTAILSSIRGSGNAALVVPNTDGGRARVSMGVCHATANGEQVVFDTFYDGIGANGFKSLGIKIGLNLAF